MSSDAISFLEGLERDSARLRRAMCCLSEAASKPRWAGLRTENLSGGKIMADTISRMSQAGRTSEAHEHSEGIVARTLESQTSKLPSDLFLWAAGASIGVSLFLQFSGKREESLFVGQWAPTFLMKQYSQVNR